MESIRKESPIPIYKQMADLIRHQVLRGELGPGDQLPSEWSLAITFKISRSSVRRAIELLSQTGMVTRIHGKGNYIRDRSESIDEGGMISLLVPDSRLFMFSNVLNGAQSAAKSRGYTLTVSFLGLSEAEEHENFNQLRYHGVKGFVIYPRNNITYDSAIWQLFQENFSFVLIDRYFPDLPSTFIGVDNVNAAFQAVSHLTSLGHRSIGFATTTGMDTTTVRDRFNGYLKALRERDIAFDPKWVFDTQSLSSSPIIPEEDEAGQIEIFRSLIRQRGCPKAFFSINDITAYMMGKAASAEGIAIPDELALVGMDDDDYAKRADVPLTTIRQPFHEIGARATHILIDRLRGSPTGIERINLPTQLVIRQSCGETLLHPKTNNQESNYKEVVKELSN